MGTQGEAARASLLPACFFLPNFFQGKDPPPSRTHAHIRGQQQRAALSDGSFRSKPLTAGSTPGPTMMLPTLLMSVMAVAATWHYAGMGGAVSLLVLIVLWAWQVDGSEATPDEAGSDMLQGQKLYKFGFSLVQGRRDYMEDYHQVDYFNDAKEETGGISHFFAVFDGHCGPKAAGYAKQKLAENIRSAAVHVANGATSPMTDDKVRDAVRQGLLKTDRDFCAKAVDNRLNDGSTGCVVMMQERRERLIAANVGDSRAILVKADGSCKPLTRDHKPDLPDERKRIEDSGGSVKMFGCARVNGILAVSRAFGDRSLKSSGVVADPEIMTHQLGADDLFLVIASDGLWDVFTNEGVAQVVSVQQDPETCARALTDSAIRKGSMDNVTVVVVQLNALPGQDGRRVRGRTPDR